MGENWDTTGKHKQKIMKARVVDIEEAVVNFCSCCKLDGGVSR